MGYSVRRAGTALWMRGGYRDDGARKQPSPAYRYNLAGEDKGKKLSDFNMEQQAQLIAHYYGATALGMMAYTTRLPSLKFALSDFIANPKNPALVPTTTKVEPKP
ncbi:hypothetical protein [Chromobacterium sp. CV08]|uniref:hypothetical protein n=1 Tax=Chromobacterium sp. CV08 TaxID=3133274 RepID=UPI003DA7DA6D